MKPLWTVCYGPDISHMWEAQVFSLLKDARQFVVDLNKPYRIYKHTWTHKFSPDGARVLIEENLR